MEKYSSGWRGAPAKGVDRLRGARVQIPPSPFFIAKKSGDILTIKKLIKNEKSCWQTKTDVITYQPLSQNNETSLHKRKWKSWKKYLTLKSECDIINKLSARNWQITKRIVFNRETIPMDIDNWTITWILENSNENIQRTVSYKKQPKITVNGSLDQQVLTTDTNFLTWEFDPGSGWTLAACLTHASRTKHLWLILRKISYLTEWRTGE